MSGVSQEDATAVDDVNLYERLGYDTFVKLSTNFYNKYSQFFALSSLVPLNSSAIELQ